MLPAATIFWQFLIGLNLWNSFFSSTFIYDFKLHIMTWRTMRAPWYWVARSKMWKYTLLWQEFIVLPGECVWSLDTYSNLSPIYHLYVFFVAISYHARFCFQISCPAMLFNANGNFKSWEFYCPCPSVRSKQSVHIVSFPVLLPGKWQYLITWF